MPQEREDSNYDWLEYEEEVEVGPIGPRTLLDFCQGGEHSLFDSPSLLEFCMVAEYGFASS